MKKNRSIRNKVLFCLFGFSLILVVLISALTGNRYYKIKIDDYTEVVYGHLHAASKFIDGDRVAGYLDTLEPDDYYDEILKYLMAERDSTNMQLFYVFVPYEDDLVYVWQTDDDPYSWLGKHENYMVGGKKTRDATFRKDPEQKITFYHDETYGNIACGFYPIFDKNGEPVALIGLDLSTPDIRRHIIGFLSVICFIIFTVSLIAARLFYVMLKKHLVVPLYRLNDASKRITADLEYDRTPDINIHTGDELEELADSFLKMHQDIRHYISENARISAEKGRLDAELGVATKIQADMLPRLFPFFPDHDDVNLYASMTPAKEVGGDFYDCFFTDDDHFVLVMADVAGKGVPAALFMARAMTAIRTRAMLGGTPSQILADVNNQMCERNDETLFVTVWLAIMDSRTWKGLVSNAGHEDPAIRRAGG